MAKALVKNFNRDCVSITPLPDAMIAQLPTSEPSIGFNPAIHLSQPRLKRHICLEKKQFFTESVDHFELKNRVCWFPRRTEPVRRIISIEN